jgi:magnesium transporter
VATDGAVRARLFDADGHDREIAAAEIDVHSVGERSLLWVDLDLDAAASLDDVCQRLRVTDHEKERMTADLGRARLDRRTDRLHLTLEAVEAPDGDLGGTEAIGFVRREIDLLAGPGVVISSHHGPVQAIDRFLGSLTGETSIGALRAADLLSSLADEVITGYQLVTEHLERRIDHLDQVALDGRSGDRLLADLVTLRQQVGFLRRTLAPHRAALAALSRPDATVDEGVGQAWPGLVERLEGSLSSVEALRDALVGTYDIHMGRVAARANDVMKALTLLSAVFLPAVVLAGLMGMNFQLPFFDQPDNYFLVVGAMVAIGVLLILVARWRAWI